MVAIAPLSQPLARAEGKFSYTLGMLIAEYNISELRLPDGKVIPATDGSNKVLAALANSQYPIIKPESANGEIELVSACGQLRVGSVYAQNNHNGLRIEKTALDEIFNYDIF